MRKLFPLLFISALILVNWELLLRMIKQCSHWKDLSCLIDPSTPEHLTANTVYHLPANNPILYLASCEIAPFNIKASAFNWNSFSLNFGTIPWHVEGFRLLAVNALVGVCNGLVESALKEVELLVGAGFWCSLWSIEVSVEVGVVFCFLTK